MTTPSPDPEAAVSPRERFDRALSVWGELPASDLYKEVEDELWFAARSFLLAAPQPQPDPDAKLRELREWADQELAKWMARPTSQGEDYTTWWMLLLSEIDRRLLATPPPESPRPVDVVRDGEVFPLAEPPPAAPHATHFDPGAEALIAERTEDGSPASELSIIAGIDMVLDHARGDKVSDAVRRLASSYVEQIKRATKAEAERDRMREGAEYNAKQLAKAEAALREEKSRGDALSDHIGDIRDAAEAAPDESPTAVVRDLRLRAEKAEAALAEAQKAPGAAGELVRTQVALAAVDKKRAAAEHRVDHLLDAILGLGRLAKYVADERRSHDAT